MSCGMNKAGGSILIITLIFVFVLTLLVVSGNQNSIIENKMQNNSSQLSSVFARADLGMQQAILQLENKSILLPDSPISLTVNKKIIDVDACDNQTLAFQSIAQRFNLRVVLNSVVIFAKVPHKTHCRKIPLVRVIGWKITN